VPSMLIVCILHLVNFKIVNFTARVTIGRGTTVRYRVIAAAW
jgi:hypothetical protein